MDGGAAPMAVTAATGALGPLLAKLRALLGDGGNSILDGRRETGDILSIKSELEAVFPLFVTLPEAEEDPGAATASKDWMGEARELFYDIEDALEDYLLDLKRGDESRRCITVATAARNPVVPDLRFLNLFRDIKLKLKEVKRRSSERLVTAEANKMPTVVDPRARFLHKDASKFMGWRMKRQKAQVMKLLAGDDIEGSASHQKLRMVWIVGSSGTGKTTLADAVYQAIGEQFQCRAFVSPSPRSFSSSSIMDVSPSLRSFSSSSIMDFLNDILRQVTGTTTVPSDGTTEQYLIQHISSVLADKRYLIIVDNIDNIWHWEWEGWEVIGSAFPDNFMGSKIILTASMKVVAKEICSDAVIYELPGVHYHDAITQLPEAAVEDPVIPDLRFLNLFRDVKMKLREVKRRCSERLEDTPLEANKMPTIVNPRARFLHRDASELVGMNRQKAKVMELLAGDDMEGSVSHQKLRMVWVVGFAGMGKTTLAGQVYQAIGEEFQCRAFASLSPPSSSSSTMGFLNDVLRQVTDTTTSVSSDGTEVATEQYLIDRISSVLADKRYLVIVDDIWRWGELEVIGSAFPENYMGSKIILTTRMKALAEKCCTDAVIYELPGIHYYDAIMLTETAILKEIQYDMRDILAISLDELCCNIEYMSRGMPLALHCLSAEAADSVLQENYDGWDTWIKHVQDGFLTIRSLKPLADSLGLVYDSLPIHLKTCLLYCTTYHNIHSENILTEAQWIERHDLVRKWIAEGFVSRLEAAETYFEELVSMNLLLTHHSGQRFYQIHPLMQLFLVCKSKEANFVTHWLDDHASAKWIHRLVIHQSHSEYYSEIFVPYSSMQRHQASVSRVRSLVICFRGSQHGPASMFDEEWLFIPSFTELFPWFSNWSFKTLGHLRVLDLQQIINIENDDLVDICKLVLLRYMGLKHCIRITVLPREIGRLQSLGTLDISSTGVTDLPMEIGELRHLETLNVSSTCIREIPREIRKLQHLKTLNLSNTRVIELPWENILFSNLVHVLAGDNNCPQLVKFSNGLQAFCLAWKNDTISSSARAMLRQDLSIMLFDHFGSSLTLLPVPGLRVTSRHTNILQWVKQHLKDVSSLDIRLCRLEEEDLKFLRQMPNLQVLALRLEISITAGGFSKLESFLVDCRLPLVAFKQGAMPKLKHLEFKFYTGRASVHPMAMGITNLQSIQKVVFWCSKNYTSDCSGIAGILKVVKEEAMEHPRRISIWINDNEEIFPENKGAQLCEENGINAASSSSDCGIKTTFAASAINHKGKAIQVNGYAYASCSHEIEEAQ